MNDARPDPVVTTSATVTPGNAPFGRLLESRFGPHIAILAFSLLLVVIAWSANWIAALVSALIVAFAAALMAALSRQRKIVKALVDSEAKFRATFDQAAIGIAHIAPGDYRILMANHKFCELLGYTQDELVGTDSRALTPPDEMPERQAERANVVAGAIKTSSCERRLIRKDGSMLWVNRSLSLVRDSAEKPTYLISVIEDISARRRAEDEVRASAAEMRLITDQMPAMLAYLDTDMRYRYHNQQYEQWAGMSAEQISGRHLSEVVGEKVYSTIRGWIEQALSGQPVFYERPHTSKTGELQHISSHLVPRYGEDGKVIGCYAVMQNIIERKRAEERLDRLNRALTLMAECSRALVHETNEVQLLHKMCRIAVESGGYRMAWVGFAERDEYRSIRPIAQAGFYEGYLESLRLSWTENDHGQGPAARSIRSGQTTVVNDILDDTGLALSREQALKQGYRSIIALPLCKEGVAFGALIIYASEVASFGTEEIALLQGLAADLAYGILSLRARADHVLAEARLRESEERMRVIFEQAAVGMVLADQATGRFLQANDKVCDMLGYGKDELVGMTIQQITHAEDLPRNMVQRDELRANRIASFAIEKRYIRKDGSPIWVNVTVSKLTGSDGSSTSTIAVIEDISERKQIEGLRIAKEAAETANRTKSEFLANMSHEIRTPMNGVLGMTELLLDTGLSELQRRYAQNVRNSADALLHIINDILDFSKIEAGRMEIDKVDFDVRELTEEVAELLASRAHAKGLELNCQIDADVPAVVGGDPGRLRQVLINLVGNAVKFTERGEIAITLKRVPDRKALAPAGSCVLHFAVRDTGIGIDAQARTRLFRAFTQADGSTTRRFGGTGLGLVICKQLAELMGGEIDLQSSFGAGSTFWFTATVTLPRVTARPEPASNLSGLRVVAEVHQERATARVLLVEDNRVNQEICKAMLSTLDCETDVVDDGRAGVETALGWRYDVVLMDCQMPEMDGFEATASIRAREAEINAELAEAGLPRRRMPIVALTANAMTGDRERCLAAGMDDYLGKPFTKEQLRAVLARWLKRAEPDTGGTSHRASPEPRARPS